MKILFILPGSEQKHSMIFAKRQIDYLISQHIECKSFFLESRLNILILIKEFFRLRKMLHSFSPDIVHCHYGTMTAFFAAFSNTKPLVITYHGSDLNFIKKNNFLKELIGKLLSQLASLRASAIICVSEKLKNRLWFRRNRVNVLPMGTDIHYFVPHDYEDARKKMGIKPDEKIILFNYSNAPVKRLDIAKATEALVQKKISRSRLWILDGNIPAETILLLLNGSDCLLLCSDSEGSPTIVKEAMACNLPVVSTDVGDVKKNIEKTLPHYLCTQEPESLARGIENVLLIGKRSNGREVLIQMGLTESSIDEKLIEINKNVIDKS